MGARTDFDRHLQNEPLLCVYALVGSESVLVAEAVAALRNKTLTRAADFNRHEHEPACRANSHAGGKPLGQHLQDHDSLDPVPPVQCIPTHFERARTEQASSPAGYPHFDRVARLRVRPPLHRYVASIEGAGLRHIDL